MSEPSTYIESRGEMDMDTCWVRVDDEGYRFGTVVFALMEIGDHEALRRDITDPDLMEPGTEDDERLEATHFAITVTYPDVEDADTQEERDELTWHDFMAMPAKKVDGVWYIWFDDVGSEGVEWYQSTYTRTQAEGVRDLAIELASVGCLYDGLYDRAKEFMGFW